MKKQSFFFVFVLLLISIFAFNCKNENFNETIVGPGGGKSNDTTGNYQKMLDSVSVKAPEAIIIKVGQSVTLPNPIIYAPSGIGNGYNTKNLTPNIIALNNGLTGVTIGLGKIMFQSTANTAKSDIFYVTVIDSASTGGGGVTSVSVAPSSVTLQTGDIFYPSVTVVADKNTSSAVLWSSSDPSVAGVDQTTGKITAISTKNGTATIYATSVADPTKKGSIVVTVVPKASGKVYSVSVSPPTVTLKTNETFTPSVTVVADNGIPTTLTWSSNDPSTASVDQSGKITAIKTSNGTATITATSVADPSKSGSIVVTVVPQPAGKVYSVSVSPPTVTLKTNETFTPSVTVVADNGISTTVNWSSSNPSVASVNSSTGKITAVSTTSGTATITATSVADPTKKGSIIVAVIPQPSGQVYSVTVAPPTVTLHSGETFTPSVTIVADNGVSTAVTWSSNDPSTASVDQSGKITAIKTSNGTATITATSVADPSKSGSIVVTVVPQPVNPKPTIQLSANKTTITVGDSVTISWIAHYATSVSASWTSKTDTVGSITLTPAWTSTFSMTAIGPGGSASDAITITVNPVIVNPPVITFDVTPSTITVGDSVTATWSVTGATNGCVSSWKGSIPTSGTDVFHPTTNTTYSLTCINSGGTSQLSKDVIVNPASGKTITISFDKSSPWAVGDTVQATTTVTPSSACSGVFWYSSDPSRVRVDQNTGLIVPTYKGTATITAQCVSDPTFKASVNVTVQ